MKDLELTKEEQALIDQWLPFYRSLADGTREPPESDSEALRGSVPRQGLRPGAHCP